MDMMEGKTSTVQRLVTSAFLPGAMLIATNRSKDSGAYVKIKFQAAPQFYASQRSCALLTTEASRNNMGLYYNFEPFRCTTTDDGTDTIRLQRLNHRRKQ